MRCRVSDTARQEKLDTLHALLAHNPADLQWKKSSHSSAGPGDCLEVAHVPNQGWLLRHSILQSHVIPLTDAEYEKYCRGVQENQPGLVPQL
ncbi:DUF397 domain-containing protein [Streptomyces sp. NPDC056500]|uniref:DUF397 domain-containing protein n=1 Tax=Streptomyces sp. NPDC056500 TaxID=3345840 RepID=UPI00367B949F